MSSPDLDFEIECHLKDGMCYKSSIGFDIIVYMIESIRPGLNLTVCKQ